MPEGNRLACVEGLLEINAGASGVFFEIRARCTKKLSFHPLIFHTLYDSVNEAEPKYPVPVRKTSLHNLC